MKTISDGIYGCVLGQAIGDAMGSQTEFNKSKRVKDLGPTWGYSYPAWSDDTQKMLATVHAILSLPPYPNHEVFMTALGKAFIAYADGKWKNNDRAPGGTVMSGISSLRRGTHWSKSGIPNGKGNGSAMAASGIGAAYCHDPIYAFELGCWTSVPTHNDYEPVLASGAIAYLVARCITGDNLHAAIAGLIGQLNRPVKHLNEYVNTGSVSFVIEHLTTAYAMANARVPFEAFRNFCGNDGKGVEAVSAAIFYNLRGARYSEVITNLANETRDSDSTAAIGGALAGARWGYHWIPRRWRKRVEETAMLHDYAKRLVEFAGKVEKEVLVEKYTPALTAF